MLLNQVAATVPKEARPFAIHMAAALDVNTKSAKPRMLLDQGAATVHRVRQSFALNTVAADGVFIQALLMSSL